MLSGGGGALLVIVGAFLLAQGAAPFALGLLVLLAGTVLVVHTLLKATSGEGGTSERRGAGRAGSGPLLDLSGISKLSMVNQWIAGAMMGVLSLIGLFLYSRAGDGMFALFGGILFFFGLAVIVVFVHRATDYSTPAEPTGQPDAEARPAPPQPAAAAVEAKESQPAA